MSDFSLHFQHLLGDRYRSCSDLRERMLQVRWFRYKDSTDWVKTPDIQGSFSCMPILVAARKLHKGLLQCDEFLGPKITCLWKNLNKATTALYLNTRTLEASYGEPVAAPSVDRHWAVINNGHLVDLIDAASHGFTKVDVFDLKQFKEKRNE